VSISGRNGPIAKCQPSPDGSCKACFPHYGRVVVSWVGWGRHGRQVGPEVPGCQTPRQNVTERTAAEDWDVRRRKLKMGLQPIRGVRAIQWVIDAAKDYLADSAREVLKEGCKYLIKFFRHDETDSAKRKVLESAFKASSLDAIEALTQPLLQKLQRVGYEQQGADIIQAAREAIFVQRLSGKSPRALIDGFRGHGLRSIRGGQAFLAHVVQKMDDPAIIGIFHPSGGFDAVQQILADRNIFVGKGWKPHEVQAVVLGLGKHTPDTARGVHTGVLEWHNVWPAVAHLERNDWRSLKEPNWRWRSGLQISQGP
jgi:hypothetical protein